MRTMISLASLCLLATFPYTVYAQNSDHSWSKTYAVTGKPSLTLDISDANVQVHSCGDCRQVSIHVELEEQKLSDYRLEESQRGDAIRFSLKEHMKDRSRFGFHVNWHRSEPKVTIDTPAELALDAHTSDGHFEASGLRGELNLRSGDGNVDMDDVKGKLRVESGDGHVRLTNAEGALEARMSDGGLTVDGTFHAIALYTSDGNLDLTLRDGSKLTEASRIESSDGKVHIRVPHDFTADLDVHTSDGHVECALPLTMDHFSSNGDSSGHGLHGKLNGGGTPLLIRTSDGNVTIQTL